MKGTKRITAVLASVLAAGALVMTTSAAAAHNYKGDINRDDKVDVADLVCLNKHFLGLSYIPEGNIKYADMDGNGKLNVIDFMCLKRAIMTNAAPVEIKEAAAETTPAVTTAKVTTAATTAATTRATTAVTTKATTAATTKATTTTTAATTMATTTTEVTTTVIEDRIPVTVTTVRQDNSIAGTDKARGVIVFAHNAEDYDYVKNADVFVDGTVNTPVITGDGEYSIRYELKNPMDLSDSILRILKPDSYEPYDNVKVTVTAAKVDGVTADLNVLEDNGENAWVNISGITGFSGSLDLTFEVSGFDSTPAEPEPAETPEEPSEPSQPTFSGDNDIAPVSANRAMIVLGGNSQNCDYVSNVDDFAPGSVIMPEITGNGTYTARCYAYTEGVIAKTGGPTISYTFLKLLKAGTYECITKADMPDLEVTITKAIIDGNEATAEQIAALQSDAYSASIDISSLLGNVNDIEIEFTVSGFTN